MGPASRVSGRSGRLRLSITCHAPLARGAMLDDPVILDVAAAHGKTPAQVALRWLVQQPDVAAVPRALSFGEINENIDLFDFDEHQLSVGIRAIVF